MPALKSFKGFSKVGENLSFYRFIYARLFHEQNGFREDRFSAYFKYLKRDISNLWTELVVCIISPGGKALLAI